MGEIKQGIAYIFGVSDVHLLNKILDTIKQHVLTIHRKFVSKLNIQEFDPLIISVGDTLKRIPWENMPIVVGESSCKIKKKKKEERPEELAMSICRIPCLEFA